VSTLGVRQAKNRTGPLWPTGSQNPRPPTRSFKKKFSLARTTTRFKGPRVPSRARRVLGHKAARLRRWFASLVTATLISAFKSATPSEAVRRVRCAIFALVAGVRCDGQFDELPCRAPPS
jgi:hypothetical protein